MSTFGRTLITLVPLLLLLILNISPVCGQDTLLTKNLSDTTMIDTMMVFPLTVAQRDSMFLDSLRNSSDLKAPLKYSAQDSIVFDFKTNIMYLYNNGKTDYQSQVLESKYIRVEWTTNLIHAEGEYDRENDSLIGSPVFSEKGQVYKAERMTYNFKSRKGKITYANTKQGTDYIIGDTIKRNPDNTFFIKGGKFTTCDADHPHFYIRASKLKMIPNDRIISGPLYMVIADIPIPIIFPFGFFPFNKKRTSGIMLPEYGETPDRGFFFRNLGYYQAINDYVDATLRADIFTNGSFILKLNPRYMLKYRFTGDLNIQYSRETFNEPTDADFRRKSEYNIRWAHNQTITPNANLTANVNFGSSQFLQRGSFNIQDNLQNNLNSNIAYSHRFNRAGWNLTAAFSQTQTVGSRFSNMTFELPNIAINKDRFFLLKRKNPTGKERWYEKIGTTYNTNIINRITNLPDSLLLTQEFFNRMQNGMRQNVAVNTNFKVLNYINITPAFNYSEFWYLKTIEKDLIRDNDTIIYINGEAVRIPSNQPPLRTGQVNGFASARDFNFSISGATQIYGILQTNSKRQRAFRHTINLGSGYSFRPDFADPSWGFYRQTPTLSNEAPPRFYSRFEGGVAGGPGQGQQQALNFNIGNVVEMKYLPTPAEGDTAKPKFKNVMLIDNFGFGGAYNFAADSFKLSNINFDLRNNVLGGKVNLNVRGTLDPYKYVFNGKTMIRKDQFSWLGDGGYFPMMTNLSFSASTQLRSREQKNKDQKAKNEAENNENKKPLTEKEQYELLYEEFKMPWTLNIGYTGGWSQVPKGNGETGFRELLTQSVNLSGMVNVTAKWKINLSTNVSFGGGKPLELGITNVAVERDLHCWVLRLDVVPFGIYRRYTMMLNVRAATLQDLRVQKQRNWQDRFGSF